MSKTKPRKQQNKTIREKDLDLEFDDIEKFVKMKKNKYGEEDGRNARKNQATTSN